MTGTKDLLKLVASCCVYALIVILIDIAAFLLLKVELTNIIFTLSLMALLEGGVALIAGSAVAFYAPVIRKVEEVVFHSEAWDAKRQRRMERQGHPWIVTGCILVLVALLMSVL